MQYIFIAATPALMIAFALIYTGRGVMLSRRVVDNVAAMSRLRHDTAD